MQKGNINRTVYFTTLLVLLVGLVFSIANLFQHGLILIRIIPAVCFVLATVLWLIRMPGKPQSTS